MGKTTVKVLKTDQPGNSLATWLAAHHPDLFLTVFKQAQQSQLNQGIRKLGILSMTGRLGDDAGTTTTFDDSGGITTTFDSSSTSPDGSGLLDVSFDPNSVSLPANLLSDSTDSGSGFLSSVGNGITSVGSTVGGTLASVGSSVFGALGSVGSYLSSATGLNNLTGLAKTYYGAQAASSTAQTQAQILQTQIARAASGQAAAPITYATNAQGQLVPVYATNTPNGVVYQPLSSQGIASLTPSSLSVFFSQYGLWLALGAAALVGLSAMRR